MKNLLDLRFIIGLFFSLVGLALFIGSLSMQAGIGKSETTNFWSGIFYIVFGVLMIILWLVGRNKPAAEEEVADAPVT